jgi:hypothetical protein
MDREQQTVEELDQTLIKPDAIDESRASAFHSWFPTDRPQRGYFELAFLVDRTSDRVREEASRKYFD